jgi:hypothetical protein
MLLLLAAIFVLVWLGTFTMFHVASAAIHVLLVLAFLSVVFHLLRQRRAVT